LQNERLNLNISAHWSHNELLQMMHHNMLVLVVIPKTQTKKLMLPHWTML
jgi:hypothetical protein